MANYILYHFQWSLFSLMARYTIALRGKAVSPEAEMKIEEKSIDLHRDENLSEQYLLEVNPKGQVPTLTSATLSTPLTNTLEITYLIGNRYQSLIPPPHRSTIEDLLGKLHAIQPLSLSIPPPENRSEGIPNPTIGQYLSQPGISDAWRNALMYKQDFHAKTLLRALDDEPIKRAEEQARQFLEDVHQQYFLHGGETWVFGDAVGATALDAHTIPFVARLIDAGRTDLIPEDVRKYAEKAMSQAEWQSITNGKPTMFEIWLKSMREDYASVQRDEPFSVWFKRHTQC